MSDTMIKVASVADIPVGEVKIFEVEDVSIAICNVEVIFYAIENVCSHDDGVLGEGKLHGTEIECPRHGARFDVTTGDITRQPAYVPVQTFPVRIENGAIYYSGHKIVCILSSLLVLSPTEKNVYAVSRVLGIHLRLL